MHFFVIVWSHAPGIGLQVKICTRVTEIIQPTTIAATAMVTLWKFLSTEKSRLYVARMDNFTIGRVKA